MSLKTSTNGLDDSTNLTGHPQIFAVLVAFVIRWPHNSGWVITKGSKSEKLAKNLVVPSPASALLVCRTIPTDSTTRSPSSSSGDVVGGGREGKVDNDVAIDPVSLDRWLLSGISGKKIERITFGHLADYFSSSLFVKMSKEDCNQSREIIPRFQRWHFRPTAVCTERSGLRRCVGIAGEI